MDSIFIRQYKFNISDFYMRESYWKQVEELKWEPYTFNIFDKFLNKNKNYVDLSAWIGPTVLYGSQLCKRCIAIEPDPIAYEQLIKNIDINNLINVDVFNLSIFNYNGILKLGNDVELGNSITRLNQFKNLFDSNCYTLSSFFEKYGIEDVNFIKMDVEGSEEFILEDVKFFEKYKPTLYLSVHNFWFNDEVDGLEKIRKIGRIYKKCYDENFNEIDINKYIGSNVDIETSMVIFTDE